MKAKEYLSKILWLDKLINSKIRYKESLEALAEKSNVTITHERVIGGLGTTSPMEDATVRLIDLKDEINEDIDKLIDMKREALRVIDKVEDFKYRLILEMRYIHNMGWDDVAKDMMLDKRWIMKLHSRALNEVEEILKLTTKRHLRDTR